MVVSLQPRAASASLMMGPISQDGSNTARGPCQVQMRVTAEVVLWLPGPAKFMEWVGPFERSSYNSRPPRPAAPIRQPGPEKRQSSCLRVAHAAWPRLSVMPRSTAFTPPPDGWASGRRPRHHAHSSTLSQIRGTGRKIVGTAAASTSQRFTHQLAPHHWVASLQAKGLNGVPVPPLHRAEAETTHNAAPAMATKAPMPAVPAMPRSMDLGLPLTAAPARSWPA